MKNFLTFFFLFPVLQFFAQETGYAAFKDGAKWGIINHEGHVVVKASYDTVLLYENTPRFVFKTDEKWGLARLTGEVITQAVYDDIVPGASGVHSVRKGKSWGYINDYGILFIPAIYTRTVPFSGNTGLVRQGDIWLLIDKNGVTKEIGAGKIKAFSEDSVFFVRDSISMILNRNGDIIKKYPYHIEFVFEEKSQLIFIQNAKYGLARYDGTILFDAVFDNLLPVKDFISVSQNGNEGYIDRENKLWLENNGLLTGVIFGRYRIMVEDSARSYFTLDGQTKSGPYFEKIAPTGNGVYAAVNQYRKWGIADTSLRIIIPIKYDVATEAGGNVFAVKTKNKWILLDAENTRVTKKRFDADDPIAEIRFKNNRAVVKYKKRYGIITSQGNNVTPFKFDFIGSLFWY
jgi:hypothetical protein